MIKNSKMRHLKDFAMNMEYHTTFMHQENQNKNGVVERNNRSLEELVRIMLNESSLPKYF